VFAALVLVGGFAAAGAGVGLYMGVIKNAPVVNVSIRPDIYTSIIYDSTGVTELDRLKGEENRVYIASEKIPSNLKNAFVAIEDERFYQHDGIDVQGIIRAGVTMVETRFGRTEGASTITQQLIKNNVNKLSSNTVVTKLQEQFMAVQFEKELEKQENYKTKARAKDHILEVYLNTINLGHGYYGVQTAAKNYFNKEVMDLSLSECAVIAAITQNPSKYTPDNKPEENRKRQLLVLDKMLELNMITGEEHSAAKDDNVYERVSGNEIIIEESTSVHSYFIDALVSQLLSDIQTTTKLGAIEASNLIYNGGLKIYATQDERIQKIVDSAMLVDSYYPPELLEYEIQYLITVTNSITGKETNYSETAVIKSSEDAAAQFEEWRKKYVESTNEKYTERKFIIPQPQVGMTVIDYHTGQVKAIAGGRGGKTDNRMFNRAVDAVRQPGSVFKILASYAPGIELGKIGPSSIIVDEPFSYNGHQFHNWWGETYKGPQTVRAGIEQSMNILAVKNMVENVGIEDAFKILQRFHFAKVIEGEDINGEYKTDKTASAALGGLTYGVTPLEMTAAFGAIANDGFYNKPVFYTKVLDHDDIVIIDNEPKPEEILKKSTAYILTDMMRGVITSSNGTGRTAKFKTIDMPIAGKTGTTTDSKDLTFAAYTPYYAAGIWTGYDQPKEMDTPNQHFHLDIWRDVMEEIHKDLEYKDFEKPGNVDMIYICQDSGLLATDFCWNDARGSRVVETPALAGNSPADYCNLHGAVTVDTSTGRKASPYCPPHLTKTIVGIVVKDEYVTDYSYQIPSSVYNGPVCGVHGASSEEYPGVSTETPRNSAEGPDTETPLIPPEFQNTEQLVPPDQSVSEQPVTDAPIESAPPSVETPTEWIEPSANPPWDIIEPIEDHNYPVVDEPLSIDDFIP
jgi:penicillin-binding protein 1A